MGRGSDKKGELFAGYLEGLPGVEQLHRLWQEMSQLQKVMKEAVPEWPSQRERTLLGRLSVFGRELPISRWCSEVSMYDGGNRADYRIYNNRSGLGLPLGVRVVEGSAVILPEDHGIKLDIRPLVRGDKSWGEMVAEYYPGEGSRNEITYNGWDLERASEISARVAGLIARTISRPVQVPGAVIE